MPETTRKRTAKSSSPRGAKKAAPEELPREKEKKPLDIAPEEDAATDQAPAKTEWDGEAHSERTPGRDRYFEAVGRRKTSVARVRLFTRTGSFIVNEKPYGIYFPTLTLQKIVEDGLKKMKLWERFRISVRVSGGGIHSQAEALRHGLARCLVNFNPDFRKRMKRAGFLTRDPRMKERKKFGLKKARRAPQWAKR